MGEITQENFPLAYHKILSLEELINKTRVWKDKGLIIVATGGRFPDGVKYWHKCLFQKARTGDYRSYLMEHLDEDMLSKIDFHLAYMEGPSAINRLIVAVNSDYSIKELGGESFYENEMHRAIEVASSVGVDAVVLFDEKTPLRIVEAIKPHVWVKGCKLPGAKQEYTVEQLIKLEGKPLTKYGGLVTVIYSGINHSTREHHARIISKSNLSKK